MASNNMTEFSMSFVLLGKRLKMDFDEEKDLFVSKTNKLCTSLSLLNNMRKMETGGEEILKKMKDNYRLHYES
jgi:hypothetical protein